MVPSVRVVGPYARGPCWERLEKEIGATQTMTTTRRMHRELADVRDHWITVTTYDVYCAREADRLLRRDRWVSNIVLAATTISSLGIFTTFVADRPDLWAKIVVFTITGLAAVLSAFRQQNDWAAVSGELRARGEGWNRLKSLLGDTAQKILVGDRPSDEIVKKIDDRQAVLLHQHPEVDTQMFAEIRKESAARFSEIYES